MYQVIEKPKSECKNGVYWYGYCLNNPLKYADPSGMLAVPMSFHDEFYIDNPEGEEWLSNYYSYSSNSHLAKNVGGGGGYYYDKESGYYKNGEGQVVSFDEYYDNHIAPYLDTVREGIKNGEDFCVFDGKSIAWYNEEGHFVAIYYAFTSISNYSRYVISGQSSKYGPIMEGSYSINCTLDPNRVAQFMEDGRLYNAEGILKVPDKMINSDENPWGNRMARLDPDMRTLNRICANRRDNNFYIHDCEKNWTSGCIGVESSFFNMLLIYAKNNDKLWVSVVYDRQYFR
jgi:hypothetical protein